jgi:hypothetical protein
MKKMKNIVLSALAMGCIYSAAFGMSQSTIKISDQNGLISEMIGSSSTNGCAEFGVPNFTVNGNVINVNISASTDIQKLVEDLIKYDYMLDGESDQFKLKEGFSLKFNVVGKLNICGVAVLSAILGQNPDSVEINFPKDVQIKTYEENQILGMALYKVDNNQDLSDDEIAAINNATKEVLSKMNKK